MNLKMRSALLFGLIVTILLSVIFSIIYFQSAWFRKEEFLGRLREKAMTTYNLLMENNQIDAVLLRIIDSTSANRLYREKIVIFDSDEKAIYSSPGREDLAVAIKKELLDKIKAKKNYLFKEGKTEAVGFWVDDKRGGSIVVASAFDRFGRRKLNNLFFILSMCWIGGIVITGVLSYIYVRKIFKPLDMLNEKMDAIAEGNLQQRVDINPPNNELAKMASNFNRMSDRLQQSFEVQKNFLQHASHELRTPLSSLMLQTEAALDKDMTNEEYKQTLLALYDDQKYLVDLVNSILSLTKYKQSEIANATQPFRIDEVLFESVEELKTYHQEYQIHVDYSSIPSQEKELTISGVPGLIKVVFNNLIRNGCIYAADKSIFIGITADSRQVTINFTNNGPVLPAEERNKLFMPFFRGSNVEQKRGHGLGLSICKRIIDLHKGQLFYTTTKEQLNCFSILLLNF